MSITHTWPGESDMRQAIAELEVLLGETPDITAEVKAYIEVLDAFDKLTAALKRFDDLRKRS